MNRTRSLVGSAGLAALLVASCGGGESFEAAPVLGAEAVCATRPRNAFGNQFFCGSAQGNLQETIFPDGARGYCVGARENIGLVGYSVTTSQGGFFEVGSQSYATNLLRNVTGGNGYIRCTRE